MSTIHHVPANHKMAWQGGHFIKDDIAFDLTARHRAALEEVLGRIRQKELAQIMPADCRHPALDADLARVFDEIQEGRGIDYQPGRGRQWRTPDEVVRQPVAAE